MPIIAGADFANMNFTDIDDNTRGMCDGSANSSVDSNGNPLNSAITLAAETVNTPTNSAVNSSITVGGNAINNVGNANKSYDALAQLQQLQNYIDGDHFDELNSTEIKNILRTSKNIIQKIKSKSLIKDFIEDIGAHNPYARLIESAKYERVEEDSSYVDTWTFKMKFPNVNVIISAQYDTPTYYLEHGEVRLGNPNREVSCSSDNGLNDEACGEACGGARGTCSEVCSGVCSDTKIKITDLFPIKELPPHNYLMDVEYFEQFVNNLCMFLVGDDPQMSLADWTRKYRRRE